MIGSESGTALAATLPNSTAPEMSVVLPVFNEEGGLATLYGRLKAVLARMGIAHEIIFEAKEDLRRHDVSDTNVGRVSSVSRGAMGRRISCSTPSSFWDGWRCSCRGRASI